MPAPPPTPAPPAGPAAAPPVAPSPARDAFRLGECEVLASLHRIRHPLGGVTRVEPKAMAVLLCLVAAEGAVVAKESLLTAVWPGRYVTEHVLSRSIAALRKALGDDARSPRYIETIPTRGFRLLQPAAALEAREPSRALPRSGRRRLVASVLAVTVALALALGWLATRQIRERPAAVVALPITAELGSEIDPALSPDGARVVFAWNGGSGDAYDLYLAPVGGGPPRRITSESGRESEPAWRPDGGAIAFVHSTPLTPPGATIQVVPANGGAVRRLAALAVADVADLEWAADGGSLFLADRPRPGAPSAVARVDARSGARQWITRPPWWAYGDRDLAVSPDSRRVAFARALLPGLEDLYVQEVGDGRAAPRRLTFDGASINGLAWLPESDEILFSSSRDGTSRLWRIAAAGGDPVSAPGLPDGALDPVYAAASRRLAFERRSFDTNVWLLELTGPHAGRRRSIARSTRWDAAPALAADGRRVAMVSDRAGTAALWTGALDGRQTLRQAPRGPPVYGRPAWSPDGRRLAVAELRHGQADLVLVDTASGARTPLAASPANEVCPAFAADGESVLYSSDAGGAWSLWRADGRRAPTRLRTGTGLCPRVAAADGEVFFVRPGAPGIWRAPLSGGAAVRVAGTEDVGPWSDWDVAGDALYVRPTAGDGGGALRIGLGSPVEVPRALALVPPAAFPGLGLAPASDGAFLLYGALDGSDGDLMQVEGYR